MKEWLRTQWRYDNHPKYQKYFEEWYNNITDTQKQYFQKQKENIEKGSLINWVLQKNNLNSEKTCISEKIKLSDHNPKKQPCVLTNRGVNTEIVKFY